jgi:hypothetical protein
VNGRCSNRCDFERTTFFVFTIVCVAVVLMPLYCAACSLVLLFEITFPLAAFDFALAVETERSSVVSTCVFDTVRSRRCHSFPGFANL